MTRLEAAGFKAKTEKNGSWSSHRRPPCSRQSPPPGASEPRGTEILLDVSAGQRQLQVPAVVGLTQSLAQDAIEKIGLEVGDVTERESQSARGAVLEANPSAGTPVSPSTRVDLVISSGPPAVNAPDVVGQSYSAARAMLEQVGLRLGDVTTDSLATGIPQTVIAQTPAAGAPARARHARFPVDRSMNGTRARIAPSILSADFARLADEIARCEAGGADLIHVDVMDGCFVPNLTFGTKVIETVRRLTDLPLDVHLMVVQPEKYFDDFARAGANGLTIHAEVAPHLHRQLYRIKELGCHAGRRAEPGDAARNGWRGGRRSGPSAGDDGKSRFRRPVVHWPDAR